MEQKTSIIFKKKVCGGVLVIDNTGSIIRGIPSGKKEVMIPFCFALAYPTVYSILCSLP